MWGWCAGHFKVLAHHLPIRAEVNHRNLKSVSSQNSVLGLQIRCRNPVCLCCVNTFEKLCLITAGREEN